MTPIARKPKTVYGFVLHCGHVESARVGTIFIRHLGDGFANLRSALVALAQYTLEGCLEEYDEGVVGLEQYQYYLDTLADAVASGPQGDLRSWDRVHWNMERWWAWDHVCDLYPILGHFYENVGEDSLSHILPHFLKLKDDAPSELREDIALYQQKPKAGWDLHQWQRARSLNNFRCVKPKRKAK